MEVPILSSLKKSTMFYRHLSTQELLIVKDTFELKGQVPHSIVFGHKQTLIEFINRQLCSLAWCMMFSG